MQSILNSFTPPTFIASQFCLNSLGFFSLRFMRTTNWRFQYFTNSWLKCLTYIFSFAHTFLQLKFLNIDQIFAIKDCPAIEFVIDRQHRVSFIFHLNLFCGISIDAIIRNWTHRPSSMRSWFMIKCRSFILISLHHLILFILEPLKSQSKCNRITRKLTNR